MILPELQAKSAKWDGSMNVVLTGSIAFDYLMTYPGYFRDHIVPEHLDSITLSFLVDTLERVRGGTAPNIGYTMALLGGKPLVFGTVGEDAGEYLTWLQQVGVDTRFIKTVPGVFTASFFANTDKANNQISSFYTGAMAHARDLSMTSLDEVHPDLVVISPNDPAAMDRYVAECRTPWTAMWRNAALQARRICMIRVNRLHVPPAKSYAAACRVLASYSSTNTNGNCCRNTPV